MSTSIKTITVPGRVFSYIKKEKKGSHIFVAWEDQITFFLLSLYVQIQISLYMYTFPPALSTLLPFFPTFSSSSSFSTFKFKSLPYTFLGLSTLIPFFSSNGQPPLLSLLLVHSNSNVSLFTLSQVFLLSSLSSLPTANFLFFLFFQYIQI